jgi:hypothetical protein
MGTIEWKRHVLGVPASCARPSLNPLKRAAAICLLLALPGGYAQSAPGAEATIRLPGDAAPAAPRLGDGAALIGLTVAGHTGERLGKVIDAVTVIDRRGGRVSYLILSRAGRDDKNLYPVPAPALEAAPDGLLLDMTGAELQGTGGFERDQWPDMTDRNWGEKLHRQFGLTPYWAQSSSDPRPR